MQRHKSLKLLKKIHLPNPRRQKSGWKKESGKKIGAKQIHIFQMIGAVGSLTGAKNDELFDAVILTEYLGSCRKKPGGLYQARDNPLPGEHMPRNDGILECWNAGYSGIGFISMKMAQVRI
jgi:hypothetical protein